MNAQIKGRYTNMAAPMADTYALKRDTETKPRQSTAYEGMVEDVDRILTMVEDDMAQLSDRLSPVRNGNREELPPSSTSPISQESPVVDKMRRHFDWLCEIRQSIMQINASLDI